MVNKNRTHMARRWTDTIKHIFSSAWIYPLLLVIALLYMYSPIFSFHYLMNDEMAYIGGTTLPFASFVARIFLAYNRAICGAIIYLVFAFVGYSPLRVLMMRYYNFVLFALLALYIYSWTAHVARNRLFGFLISLFLFAQLPFQGMISYSLIFISHVPAFWLSLASFHYFFTQNIFKKIPSVISWCVVFVLLMLAMQTHHVFAFFALIPLTYLVLHDWPDHRKHTLQFIVITVAALITSGVIYKSTLFQLHQAGLKGYGDGEIIMEQLTRPGELALRAINPVSYWSAFKLWTYPIPSLVPEIGSLSRTIALFVMMLWILLLGFTIAHELRSAAHKQIIIQKWLVVFVCIGLGALFLVVDAIVTPLGDHRPHIATILTGLVIITSGYCFQVLHRSYQILRHKSLLFLLNNRHPHHLYWHAIGCVI